MYPQVIQLETRRLATEQALKLTRERARTRHGVETASAAPRTRSLRLRTLIHRASL
jgi:hypothetical protein